MSPLQLVSVLRWRVIYFADDLSEAGWSWGCVSAVDSNGRTIFVADAHRDDGKRFVVRADEKPPAFVELEGAICVLPGAQKIKHIGLNLRPDDLIMKLGVRSIGNKRLGVERNNSMHKRIWFKNIYDCRLLVLFSA